MQSPYASTLESVGVTCIIFGVIIVAKYVFEIVYNYAIGPLINKLDYKSLGQWALVTGSTDGIGKQYAFELAARGCDIVLVSRSLDKLKATAQHIETEYKVSTKIIQADFTAGEEIYDKIEKDIEGLEIGTLVNNVGISYPYPEYFLDIPDGNRLISNLIRANIVSVTRMTKLVMPAMVKRGRGCLINIGSASSMIPSPLLTVYAATKAYVEKFTEGLDMEYTKHGLVIQCVLPGFVCSNMSGIRRSTLFAPNAQTFVSSAIGLVGTLNKTTGYLPHCLFVNTLNLITTACYNFAIWLVTRSMENSRRKAIKKTGKLEA